MAFERFVPAAVSRVRPRATFRPSGLISFDAASVDAFQLNEASHAVLFFDKTKKLVGIKTTRDDGEAGAIPLAKRRRSVSLKAPQFFERFAITLDHPRRFDVAFDEAAKMMTIDIKTVRRRRGRRPRTTA